MASVHKTMLQTSDAIAYVFIAAGLILEILVPTGLDIDRFVRLIAGVGLLLLSWIVIILAKREFRRAQQKSAPGFETTALVTTGIFRYSRNPMYAGVALLAPALGLIVGSAWVLLLSIPIVLLMNHLLILPEERYLLDTFGDTYTEYRNKVRRWL